MALFKAETSALPFTSCVTSGMFLNLSEPPMLLWKINKIVSVRGHSAIAISVSVGV